MHYPVPPTRKLRVYAFDPSISVSLDTAIVNDAIIELPWEKGWEDPVELGPINEYFEVIDIDPASDAVYQPLDLNDRHVLAQSGLPPSEGCPQFHQQMVFAVAMKTVKNFERALGRPVFWSAPDDYADEHKLKRRSRKGSDRYPDFIKRLRIYPHAMREANAYFSPQMGALLFGYFRTGAQFEGHEGEWVFTCLSQDIIVHEVTHAILHGMRRRHIEPTNPDVLAFHEAFADTIALLQHCGMREVVEFELGRTGGVLRSHGLLTGLARQFGLALGREGGALRLALDQLALEISTGKEPARLADAKEPHRRGQFLVAAIFDAFVSIYEKRTDDLFRIAGQAPGSKELSRSLISRLAAEASEAAEIMTNICVRALDYLPPVDATFGDYLRAIITADTDLVPNDLHRYRVAIAESFRERGLPVRNVFSYAPDSLCWDPPDVRRFEELAAQDPKDTETVSADALFSDAFKNMEFFVRLSARSQEQAAVDPSPDEKPNIYSRNSPYMDRSPDERNLREEAMRVVMRNQAALHGWLRQCSVSIAVETAWEDLLGLRTLPLDLACLTDIDSRPLSIEHRHLKAKVFEDQFKDCTEIVGLVEGETKIRVPKFEVHSVRIARRTGPGGNELYQMIAQVTQRRYGYFDPDEQTCVDKNGPATDTLPDFWFRGGSTIVVDLRDGRLKHVVRYNVCDNTRLARVRQHLLGDETALALAMSEVIKGQDPDCIRAEARQLSGIAREPFAFVHHEMEPKP